MFRSSRHVRYVMPTTIEAGPTRCLTYVSRDVIIRRGESDGSDDSGIEEARAAFAALGIQLT